MAHHHPETPAATDGVRQGATSQDILSAATTLCAKKKRPGGCGWHKFLKPEPKKKVPQTPPSHLALTLLGRPWDNVRDRYLYVDDLQ